MNAASPKPTAVSRKREQKTRAMLDEMAVRINARLFSSPSRREKARYAAQRRAAYLSSADALRQLNLFSGDGP